MLLNPIRAARVTRLLVLTCISTVLAAANATTTTLRADGQNTATGAASQSANTTETVDSSISTSMATLFPDSLAPLSTATLASMSSLDFTTESISPAQSARTIIGLPDLAAYEASLISARRPKVRISAQSVIARTIQKNLNVRQRQVLSARSRDEVSVRQGIFDLNIRGLANALRDESPTDLRSGPDFFNNTTIRRTTRGTLNAGLDQLLSTGATLSLDVDSIRTETNTNPGVSSPLEEAKATLQVRQPLLQGAGPFVTRAQIVIAQLNDRAAIHELRSQLLREISISLQLYYDLVFAVANVEVLRVALDQAEELLRVNTAKYNAGVLPELDVLQAQSDVGSRLTDVVVAVQEVENASDRLRLQLGEIGDKRDVSLRPAESATVPPVSLSETAAVATALKRRPEMEITALSIEQGNVQVGVAENATLPRLDATAGVGFAGANVGTRGAFSDLYDREGSSWNAGLQFSYPLQNRSARGRLSQSRRDLEAATIQRQQVRDQILLEVRNAIRAVETNKQKVAVGRATVEFNLAKVDSGQKRQQVGLATSFDVLAFQRDLANARSQLILSVVDLNKSLIRLEEAKGTLLDRMGVEMRGRKAETSLASSRTSRANRNAARATR